MLAFADSSRRDDDLLQSKRKQHAAQTAPAQITIGTTPALSTVQVAPFPVASRFSRGGRPWCVDGTPDTQGRFRLVKAGHGTMSARERAMLGAARARRAARTPAPHRAERRIGRTNPIRGVPARKRDFGRTKPTTLRAVAKAVLRKQTQPK
jgi:hypothetical protein